MEESKTQSAGSSDTSEVEAGLVTKIERKRFPPQRLSTPSWTEAGATMNESSPRSAGSCPPTPIYFEMVDPFHPSRDEQAVVVVVGEDDQMVEFEFVETSRPPRSSKVVVTKEQDQEQEEIDTLDGELLPDFFSYTHEEREWIRGTGCREGAAPTALARDLQPREVEVEVKVEVEEDEEEDYSHLWAYKI